MKKYFGSFPDYESMLKEFVGYTERDTCPIPEGIVPTPSELIFASYGGAGYEGDAFVLFRKGSQLYEVHGSHCSCFGLENQWKPEETTIKALAMRKKENEEYSWYFLSDHAPEAITAYWRLVDRLIGNDFPWTVK